MKTQIILGLILVLALAGCGGAGTSTVAGSPGTDSVTLVFNITVPGGMPEGAQVAIASSLNNWNALDRQAAATKIDATHYRLSVTGNSSQVGSTITYKWALVLAGQTDNGLYHVECGAGGSDMQNRSYTIHSGENTINDVIAGFKNLDETIPNPFIPNGKLETFQMKMEQFADQRMRTIRVWLPEGYNANDTAKTYPVMYMQDAQNLFDFNTSFSGEWQVDEAISNMVKAGYGGTIVVGIDNGVELRADELSPLWDISTMGAAYIKAPAGDKYAAFITNTLKPYIDAHYNTKPEREYTGIGGSSMGGIMSFYMAMEYPETYGYALVFSPALHVYVDGTIESYIQSKDFSKVNTLPRVYIYAGGFRGEAPAGAPFDESCITKYVNIMKNQMVSKGYPEAKINTLIDLTQTHIEAAWGRAFPAAYRWLVGF